MFGTKNYVKEDNLFKTITLKIKNFFKKNKSPIPFAEYSQANLQQKKTEKRVSDSFKQEDKKNKKPVKKTESKIPEKKEAIKPKKKPWAISQYPVPKVEGKIRFQDLNLSTSIIHAIADLKFEYCTPIQAAILPEALQGKDAIGKAQTGTGKSAAFIITIISHLQKNPIKGGPKRGFPRALILAPTRELAVQIEKDTLTLTKYTPFKVISLFGGMGYEKQKNLLKQKSFDIVIATPGRLIDFNYQKLIHLRNIELLVLDEADRMLDMGFIPDVRKIVYKTPHKDKRQTMFYSATFTPEVSRLAEQWTKDSITIDIEPENVATTSVQQIIYLVTSNEKFTLLYNLLKENKTDKVLIFTNRRDQARDLHNKILQYGFSAAHISGEVQQKKRMSALENFRNGITKILVATDVAGRGIHIDGISHVINYHLPQDPENYVHRIGRTGRAGASGISISFASEDDSFNIPDIETFLGEKLVCEHPDDSLLVDLPAPSKKAETRPLIKKQPDRNKNYRKKNYQGKKQGTINKYNKNIAK